MLGVRMHRFCLTRRDGRSSGSGGFGGAEHSYIVEESSVNGVGLAIAAPATTPVLAEVLSRVVRPARHLVAVDVTAARRVRCLFAVSFCSRGCVLLFCCCLEVEDTTCRLATRTTSLAFSLSTQAQTACAVRFRTTCFPMVPLATLSPPLRWFLGGFSAFPLLRFVVGASCPSVVRHPAPPRPITAHDTTPIDNMAPAQRHTPPQSLRHWC